MPDPVFVQPSLSAQSAALLAKMCTAEARRTSNQRERLRLLDAARRIQEALDRIPCPSCHGSHLIRRSVWDQFAAAIAAEFPGELTPDQEYEIDVRREIFAAEHGPELQPCPRCQSATVRERRAA